MTEQEKMWQDMMHTIVGALSECIDSGKAFQMNVASSRPVTIEIYSSKAQMKVFDEAILKAAKQHRGIDVVK